MKKKINLLIENPKLDPAGAWSASQRQAKKEEAEGEKIVDAAAAKAQSQGEDFDRDLFKKVLAIIKGNKELQEQSARKISEKSVQVATTAATGDDGCYEKIMNNMMFTAASSAAASAVTHTTLSALRTANIETFQMSRWVIDHLASRSKLDAGLEQSFKDLDTLMKSGGSRQNQVTWKAMLGRILSAKGLSGLGLAGVMGYFFFNRNDPTANSNLNLLAKHLMKEKMTLAVEIELLANPGDGYGLSDPCYWIAVGASLAGTSYILRTVKSGPSTSSNFYRSRVKDILESNLSTSEKLTKSIDNIIDNAVAANPGQKEFIEAYKKLIMKGSSESGALEAAVFRLIKGNNQGPAVMRIVKDINKAVGKAGDDIAKKSRAQSKKVSVLRTDGANELEKLIIRQSPDFKALDKAASPRVGGDALSGTVKDFDGGADALNSLRKISKQEAKLAGVINKENIFTRIAKGLKDVKSWRNSRNVPTNTLNGILTAVESNKQGFKSALESLLGKQVDSKETVDALAELMIKISENPQKLSSLIVGFQGKRLTPQIERLLAGARGDIPVSLVFQEGILERMFGLSLSKNKELTGVINNAFDEVEEVIKLNSPSGQANKNVAKYTALFVVGGLATSTLAGKVQAPAIPSADSSLRTNFKTIDMALRSIAGYTIGQKLFASLLKSDSPEAIREGIETMLKGSVFFAGFEGKTSGERNKLIIPVLKRIKEEDKPLFDFLKKLVDNPESIEDDKQKILEDYSNIVKQKFKKSESFGKISNIFSDDSDKETALNMLVESLVYGSLLSKNLTNYAKNAVRVPAPIAKKVRTKLLGVFLAPNGNSFAQHAIEIYNNWVSLASEYRLIDPDEKEKQQENKYMDNKTLKQIVSEVISENHGKGYTPYPYHSHIGNEEEEAADFVEDWKDFEMSLVRDESRNTAIEVAKILVKDLELFGDVLDLVGQNQSVATEILKNMRKNEEKA